MTTARKPRVRQKKASLAASETELKSAVLKAALPHIPFDGFTQKTLEQAAGEAGVDGSAVLRLFPKGPLSLVEIFSQVADCETEQRLAKARLPGLKVRERIALAVRTRIEVLAAHKEAARRAAAFLSLPPNAPTAAKLIYNTVDSIWRAVGDTSTDFNFYTKRALLAAVYSSTLVRWFNDDYKDQESTWTFLDRRIADVMRIEKLKANIREQARKLPSLTDILRGPSPRRTAR
jgi:ubiquinone biosynthesis protein COQ9